MKAFFALALSLAYPLAAAETPAQPAPLTIVAEAAQPVSATAAPEAASPAASAATPVALSASAAITAPFDHVSLKDGQRAEGRLRGYDAFFLDFQSKNGTIFHLPWAEIAEVTPSEFSGDTALMKQYISTAPAEVQSRIVPKDPSRAFAKALWPGFIIHGRGFQEAGNTDAFLSLAGAELFGILVGGFGAARAADPTLSQGERDTAQALELGGLGVFAFTWLVDLAGAPISASHFNSERGLSLSLAPNAKGGALALARMRF